VSLYSHVPHPHVARRKAEGPVKTTAQLPRGSAYARFNTRVALAVTHAVGSMTCAWCFAAIALISLPAAITSGSVIIIVSWVAQTFLQLVLLAVIIVGQNIQAAGADKRAEQTFLDAEAVLAEATKIQEHLAAQDSVLTSVVSTLMTGPGTHGGREKHL
jgi:hypothetical protein